MCVFWWIYNEALRTEGEGGGSIISTVEGPLFFAQRINPFPILERGRGGGLVGFIADSQ